MPAAARGSQRALTREFGGGAMGPLPIRTYGNNSGFVAKPLASLYNAMRSVLKASEEGGIGGAP
jgi:hypothetical protein